MFITCSLISALFVSLTRLQSNSLTKVVTSRALETETKNATSKKTIWPVPMEGFRNVWDPPHDTDIPVFWHIAKSGGSSFKDIFGRCHRLTMASEVGTGEGHHKDTDLGAYIIGDNPFNKFVNVDTTKIKGLERAKKMGLAKSGLADVIVTRHIFEVDSLFDKDHRGQLISVFRDPIDRAISLFSYLQYADWELTYSTKLANMTLEEFGNSSYIEDNWLLRFLSNSYDQELTEADMIVAKRLLREKFLIGLLNEREETMDRFEKFFGWKYKIDPKTQEACRENFMSSGSNTNKNSIVKPKPGSKAYEAIAARNRWDMQLYEYIESLFWDQEKLFRGVPDNFRLEGATCCSCKDPPIC